MIALSLVLSFFGIKMPFGGRMTLASMVPVILVSYMFDTREALLVSFGYSLLQIICDFTPPPVQNFSSFFAVCMLDYIIAFTVLGIAGNVSKEVKNVKIKSFTGSAVVVLLLFLCHFLSGILIWKCYAPEGQSPVVYSLLYNGGYMGGELIVTTIIVTSLSDVCERLKSPRKN